MSQTRANVIKNKLRNNDPSAKEMVQLLRLIYNEFNERYNGIQTYPKQTFKELKERTNRFEYIIKVLSNQMVHLHLNFILNLVCSKDVTTKTKLTALLDFGKNIDDLANLGLIEKPLRKRLFKLFETPEIDSAFKQMVLTDPEGVKEAKKMIKELEAMEGENDE